MQCSLQYNNYTESRDVTWSVTDVKYTIVLYNLIGRRRRYDVNNAVPLLVEKTACNHFLDSILAFMQDFHQILRRNECKYKQWIYFSDVYRIINYTGSLAKFTWTPLGFIHFARDPV